MFENEKGGFGCPNDDCRAMIEKFLTICLPVTVKPKVKVGKIKAECCGNPIVSGDRHEKCCKDMQKDSCHFTIIQKMKVEIPIDFNADTDIDELFVDCELKHEHEPPKPDCDCRT